MFMEITFFHLPASDTYLTFPLFANHIFRVQDLKHITSRFHILSRKQEANVSQIHAILVLIWATAQLPLSSTLLFQDRIAMFFR